MHMSKTILASLAACCVLLSVSGCEEKEAGTKAGNPFVQSIAQNDKPEKHRTFTGIVRGAEIKLTYYYKGDVIIRQDAENTLSYKALGADNKEQAKIMLGDISEAWQKTKGITENITYSDDHIQETMSIDYTTAEIKELCKLPGMSMTDCSASFVGMTASAKAILKEGYKEIYE